MKFIVEKEVFEKLPYTYSHRYAWRKEVPDGKKYSLKPTDCETEQEYLEAYRERKYAWRELYTDEDTLDLNIEDFETQKDFLKAFNAKMSEKRKKDHTWSTLIITSCLNDIFSPCYAGN